MTWIYKNTVLDELPDDVVGFVYLITNLTNQRMYVGKKLAKFSKISYRMQTQKNGLKVRKKIRSKIESDWRDYYGSSIELTKDIDLLGKEQFRREILHFCHSKGECSYLEAKEQFFRGVLESDQYYNGHIQVRVHKKHVNKLAR